MLRKDNFSIMKKVLLFVATVMLLGSASAQDFQKEIFGVRAGLNLANINTNFDVFTNFESKPSFNVGFSYERLILNDKPIYLETGLLYSNKGYKYTEVDYDEVYDIKASLSYLELPLMVNYKLNIGNGISVYPSAGVYYAFAFAGKEREVFKEEDSDGDIYKEIYISDCFGEYGIIKRSDFGYRVSASASYKKYVLSVGYEGSLLNIAKTEADDDIKAEIKNSNLFISLGYNF